LPNSCTIRKFNIKYATAHIKRRCASMDGGYMYLYRILRFPSAINYNARTFAAYSTAEFMNIKTSRKYCRDRQTGVYIYKDRTTVYMKNERCFHLRELSCWRSNRFSVRKPQIVCKLTEKKKN